MDFDRLNRRQLQYLCKLNKIPANITNIAMAHSLKSLHTVDGLEEFLNPSQSESAGSSIESPEKIEVTSPRVPRMICRTSTWQKVKKPEVENMGRTASRVVRKHLSGEVSDFLKTSSVASTKKKVLATSSRQNVARQDTIKKQTTVQRVYNTRRSARLMEKKCSGTGAIERERTQSVKIDLLLDEVSATSEEDLCIIVSEKSSGSGSSSIGTSHELDVSSENIKDSVAEGSVESCDVGISKSTVEGMCNAFEKLDVLVVNGNDQISTIQKILPDTTLERPDDKVDCCDELDILEVKSVENFEQQENVDLEDRHNVVENLVVNDFDTSKDWNGQVHKLKPNLEGISYSCEDEDLEENLMVANEKIDPDEAPIVSVNQNNLTTENILPADSTFESGEKKVDCCRELGGINVTSSAEILEQTENVYLEERWNVGENIVLNEVRTSDSEENGGQKGNLKPDSGVISSSCEDGDLEEKLMVGNIQELKIQGTLLDATLESGEEEVGFCDELNRSKLKSVEHFERHENVDLKDTQIIVEKIVMNEVVTSEEIGTIVDNLKLDLEIVSYLSEDGDSEEKLTVADKEVDSNEALHGSVSEQRFTTEKTMHVDSTFESGEKKVHLKINLNEANISVEEEMAYVDPEEHSHSLLSDKARFLSGSFFFPSDVPSLELEELSSVVSETKDEMLVCNGSTDMAVDLIHFNSENPSYLSKLHTPENDNVSQEMAVEGAIGENILKNTADAVFGNFLNLNEQELSVDVAEEEYDNIFKIPSDISFKNIEDNVAEGGDGICDVGILKAKVEGMCNAFEKLDVFVLDESVQVFTIQKTLRNATLESGEEVDCCDELDSSKVKSVEHFEPHESLELEDRQSVGENFVLNELGNHDSEERFRHINNLKHDSESIFSYSEDGDLKEKLMVDKIQNSKIQETLPDAKLENGEEVGCCDDINNSKLKSAEHFQRHENADLENTQNVVEKIVLNEVVTLEERTLVDNLKLDLEIISYLSEDGGSEEKLIFADKKVDSNKLLNVSVNEQILTTEKSMHVDSTFESGEKVDCCGELDSIHVTSVEIVDHYENVALNEVDKTDSDNSGKIDNLKHNSESISSSCEDGDLEEKLMVVNEKSNLNEASNTSVEQENAFLALKEHPDSFLSEANVINAEANLFDTQSPSDATSLELEDMFNVVSEMKSETMELNEVTNMAGDIIHLNSKSSSDLSKLDYPDNQSVTNEMTEEGIEVNIFTSTADAVLIEYMNPNEQELSMDFGPAEKEHDIFSKSLGG